MAAAALSHRLDGLDIDITLVESAEIGTVGVGEATLPQIRAFNRMLDIDERELMAKTAATIKLGIEFCDWGRIGDSYIHPFGVHGEQIGPADFHHYWVKEHAAGNAAPFDSYCYPIMAAKYGRFKLPKPGTQAPLEAFEYAFQFDASLYGKYLSGPRAS